MSLDGNQTKYEWIKFFRFCKKLYQVKVKFKTTVPSKYVIEDLNGEKIGRTLYEGELQKTNQTEFRVEKVIKNK